MTNLDAEVGRPVQGDGGFFHCGDACGTQVLSAGADDNIRAALTAEDSSAVHFDYTTST